MALKPTLSGIQNSIPVLRNPFFEIYTQNRPQGGTVVYWGLRRDFLGLGPYVFTVEWAESATATDDAWEHVATVEDTYWAEDPTPRQFAVSQDSYYRITVEFSTRTGARLTERSVPTQSTGTFSKKDWLIAREVIRKEQLMATKFTGYKGYLLKRKIWGEPCPVCADHETLDAQDGKCPVCFGTGKKGGYWPGHLIYPWEPQGGSNQTKKIDNELATRNDRGTTMRVTAFPHIESYDIFVDISSGKRYVCRSVASAANVKGIDLVYMVEMRVAPYTDIIYSVPVTQDGYVEPVEEEPLVVYTPPAGSLSVAAHDPLDDGEPPTPPPPADVDVEDPLAPVLHVPMSPDYAIWWDKDAGQWMIGTTIGDPTSVSYRTTNGTSNPFFLHAFDWDGPISLTQVGENVTIGGYGDHTGEYLWSGMYNDTWVFVQQGG